jgi:Zn-dependent alcohol dehydrogenase
MVTDGTHRHHLADGSDLNTLAKLGTFAEHMVVASDSLVKVDPDVGMIPAALVSCGVATGFGSAVNRAEVGAGDTVVVVGCGGIGSNALQGAKAAGAKNVVAVDPSEFKRESATRFGATHTAPSMEEAMELVGGLTVGVMADSVILTPSVLTGELIAPAQFLTRKGGTIVATAVAPAMQMDVQLNLFEFAMMNKELKGCLFGSTAPRKEIPHLLSMYQAGQLKLGPNQILLTRTPDRRGVICLGNLNQLLKQASISFDEINRSAGLVRFQPESSDIGRHFRQPVFTLVRVFLSAKAILLFQQLSTLTAGKNL